MSKKKCKKCGASYIEYPIWKGQESGEPFALNKINWYNLLIGDWTKVLIFITLLFVAWAYMHDTQVVRDIYSNPCDFVNKNRQACSQELNLSSRFAISDDLDLIDIINLTDKNAGQP